MKKTVKIISTLLMILMLICTISTISLAKTDYGTIINEMDGGTAAPTGKLNKSAANIVATLRNVAAIAAVIIIVILGIKYMLGSVEEKAEYKKSFMPLIIGIVVVLAATQIATMIFNVI